MLHGGGKPGATVRRRGSAPGGGCPCWWHHRSHLRLEPFGSNQALRDIGGAVVGQQVGKAATKKQAFDYTILVDGRSTITMVTDEAGMRVGDCVAVERGSYNNLRLVDDAHWERGSVATPAEVKEADACVAAKQQLLEAKTDEAFNLAERRVRLLCAD